MEYEGQKIIYYDIFGLSRYHSLRWHIITQDMHMIFCIKHDQSEAQLPWRTDDTVREAVE
jgi:hypothetical protein